ncbi:MAG: divalent metal cation transporter [Azospirillaceae bacterium]|nr:divalent metal cation transporter [Azospirillaceae bacterium]
MSPPPAALAADFPLLRWSPPVPVKRRRLAALGPLLLGPGVLAMLGENDGPSMLSYATSGASYGLGFFLPFILVTFAAAYCVQEMAMRLGVASGRGYGELMFQRFGRGWGWISAVDLILTNLVTLVTEVIAIRLGMGFFGIPAWVAVVFAVLLVAGGAATGRYARWERVAAGLALFNLAFVAVALLARPDPGAITHALTSWDAPKGAGAGDFLMMVASTIGATVTPWMLFFQQSATVDKGLSGPGTSGEAAIRTGRLNTAMGAVLAAIAGGGALVAATPLFTQHIDMAAYLQGGGFAQALSPLIGRTGAALFALGLIEAGAVAMLTISASGAYAVGEMVAGAVCSFDAGPRRAPLFHAVNVGTALVAGLVVLIPGAPLMDIVMNANLLATILMPAALVFLLILANDPVVMGAHVNGRLTNMAGIAITVAVTLAGGAYAVVAFLDTVGLHVL